MNSVLYIHGKGGNPAESSHWFHTEEEMKFIDACI